MRHLLFVLLTTACLLIPGAITDRRPLSAATQQQTLRPTPIDEQARTTELTTTINLPPFTLTFPTAWSVRYSYPETIEPPTVTDANNLETIRNAATDGTEFAHAWQTTTAQQISLVAAVTPADKLTLSAYLTNLTRSITQPNENDQSRLTLNRAKMLYDLHQDGVPIALAQCTITHQDRLHTQPTDHYHAAIMNRAADKMLLLTFRYHTAQHRTIEATIDNILAQIQQE
jgi:hypothetical protein